MAIVCAGCDDDLPGTPDSGSPPADAAPDQGAPDQGAPDQAASDQAAPDQAAPDQATPDAAAEQGAGDLAAPDLTPDQAVVDATQPDLFKLDIGAVTSKDFVASQLLLPTTSSSAKLGVDLDGDGLVDNALGSILALIGSLASGLNLQQVIDDSVNAGNTLLLLRLKAASFTTAPAAIAQTFNGQPQTCCTSPLNSTLCAAQAKTTCFTGSATFTPDPAHPAGYLFGGKITAGALAFGPSKMTLKMPLVTATSLSLDLKAAHIQGTLSGGTISNGVLAGAVTQTDLKTKVIPAVATMLNHALMDPLVDASSKAMIKTLFDTNSDGTITAAELMANVLIMTFLAGDVDVDKDGVKELSLGLGFTAVGATIK